MKTSISIMTMINRLLITPFLVLVLLSIIKNDIVYFAAICAFGIGVYQILSFLLTLFYVRWINKKQVIIILFYFCIVLIYFLSLYILSNFYEVYLKEPFLAATLYSIPVLASLFWTYILETLYKKT